MWRTRLWQVALARNPVTLAVHLTDMDWVGCQGFRLRNYLFLNDATSPDGAQEYGVVKIEEDELRQVESITFSWCSGPKALNYIYRILGGRYDYQTLDRIDPRLIQFPRQHGTCQLCA